MDNYLVWDTGEGVSFNFKNEFSLDLTNEQIEVIGKYYQAKNEGKVECK
jgi:hypothetical protein